MPTRPASFLVWAVLLLVGGGVCAASMWLGAESDPSTTVLLLRFWRLACSLLAGGALAVGGVLVQGLLRNPLASPSILGTTAGANVGGIAILLGWGALMPLLPDWLPAELLLPLGCIAGAVLALAVLLALTQRGAGVVTVLLTGFILTALLGSVGTLLMSLAAGDWVTGRAILSFSMGGMGTKGVVHAALAAPLVVAGVGAAYSWRDHLDVLLSGEDEAATLGVDVDTTRRWVVVWTAVLTAAAVAIGGNVAFVGLVIPHALRPWIGETHGRLIPAAAVCGGVFLAACDVVTKLGPAGAPIPLGVVTGLIGAPAFLVLLRRAAHQGVVQ